MRPVEYLVVEFPGNKFKGEIIPVLQELVEKSVISVIDMILIRKDQDGTVTTLELQDMDPGEAVQYEAVVTEVAGLLSAEDVREIAAALSPNSSAGVLVFEDAWTDRLLETIENAEGIVLALDRIPMEKVDEAKKSVAETAV